MNMDGGVIHRSPASLPYDGARRAPRLIVAWLACLLETLTTSLVARTVLGATERAITKLALVSLLLLLLLLLIGRRGAVGGGLATDGG